MRTPNVFDCVTRYKDAYQQLKDLKLEIEHLQHLLEQARHRLTRDFEHWYINVYLATEDPAEPSVDRSFFDTNVKSSRSKSNSVPALYTRENKDMYVSQQHDCSSPRDADMLPPTSLHGITPAVVETGPQVNAIMGERYQMGRYLDTAEFPATEKRLPPDLRSSTHHAARLLGPPVGICPTFLHSIPFSGLNGFFSGVT